MDTLALHMKKINIKNLNYLFYIPLGMFSFFIPNIAILKTTNPFIAVYLSILISKKNSYKFYISSFFIFLGIIINNSNELLVKNISVFILLQTINFFLNNNKNKLVINVFSRAVITSICLLLSNLLLIYGYKLSYFYIINSLFEASLGFILTLLLYKGILLFDFNKLKYLKKVSSDEIFSLVLFISIILLCMQNYYIGNINVQLIFFIFLSLIVAYNFNSSQSVLVAFIFVFLTGVLTNSVIKTFGYMLLLSAFLSGLYKNKIFNILSYMCGIVFMYVYYFVYNVKVFNFETISISFFISSSLFYLIPENVLNITYNSLIYSENIKEKEVLIKIDFLQQKFNDQLQILNKLSNVFKIQYVSLKNKKIEDDSYYENLNLRFVEANYLLHKQYEFFKKDIEKLLDILNNKYSYKHGFEIKIKENLKYNSILVESVLVFLNEKSKIEVVIKKHRFSMLIKTNEIATIITEIVKRKMVLINEKDGVLHFVENSKFNVIHSVATIKKGKNKLSGDTFSVIQNKNEDITFTLCDGMGSGDVANKHSTFTIELFEELVNLKFDKKMAIDLVNSMLLIREDGEFFSSLDCCSINKFTGVLNTYKVGASSTYILRDNSIDTISSSTLPIGILNNVSVDHSNMQLEAGDVIIMMTDGVIDSNYSVVDKENYLAKKLSKCNKKTPQGIVEYLIEETRKQYEGEVLDDCTILVSKIW